MSAVKRLQQRLSAELRIDLPESVAHEVYRIATEVLTESMSAGHWVGTEPDQVH